MEVDKLQIFTHFVLVLDLSFFLYDRVFDRHVLRLKFLDQSFLLLQFVEHVLRELLSVVLTDPTVLGSG